MKPAKEGWPLWIWLKGARTEDAASRAKNGRVFNKAVAAMAFNTRLALNMVDDTTEVDQAELLNGPLLHLTMLQTGKLTDTGFIDINEANAAAFCLAGELYRNGDTETRRQLNETTVIYTTAADALAAIGTRCMRTNRYGATGDELQAIRTLLDMYGQLIAVAPRGLVCRALLQAQKITRACMPRPAASAEDGDGSAKGSAEGK